MKHLVREMYCPSHHDVLCGLCKQAERADLVRKLKCMAIRGLQERAMFESLLARCQEEIGFLRQHMKEEVD
jgi:hypothetical protein